MNKTFWQINFEQHGRHFCVGVISITHQAVDLFNFLTNANQLIMKLNAPIIYPQKEK